MKKTGNKTLEIERGKKRSHSSRDYIDDSFQIKPKVSLALNGMKFFSIVQESMKLDEENKDENYIDNTEKFKRNNNDINLSEGSSPKNSSPLHNQGKLHS